MLLVQTPPPPPPSVVVCVLDDLSWPDLDAAETPAIDALRAEGVSFTGFHAMPVCSPTRVALWTGRLPRRMGVGEGISHYRETGDDNPTVGADLVTLPRLLAAQGYTTCLVGKWHAGAAAAPGDAELAPERSALDVGGFDHWLAGTPGNLRAGKGRDYARWWRVDEGVGRVEETYATAAQVEAALAWWRATDGPRLLVVSLNAPHPPFHDPPEAWRRRDHGPRRTDRYLEMVESADLAVEAVRRAVGDDVWFFVVSDNGTPPAVNGAGKRAKTTTFDRGVRVPLVVTGPGLAPALAGREEDALVSCTDLWATVAELVGAEPPAEAAGGEDSVSFAAALRSPDEFAGRPFVFAEKYDSNPENQGFGEDLMVRDARWKLRRVDGVERFHDLVVDPLEHEPRDPATLAGEELAAYRRLAAHLATLPPRSR